MIQGVICFLTGLKSLLLEQQLRAVLWRMVGLLMLLLIIWCGGVFWLMLTLSNLYIPTGDAWYIESLQVLAWSLSILLALLIGIVSYAAFAAIAASPWLDELAARAEAPSTENNQNISWWKAIAQSLKHMLMPLLYLLPFAVVALLCLAIPVIGTIAATMIWGYGGLRFLAFEFMDTPASRRNWGWTERKQHYMQKKSFYLGLTATASILLFIPLLNILAVPAAVVALSRHFQTVNNDT